MSTNDALKDEVEALTSIYDSEVLTITADHDHTTHGGTTAVFSLPNIPYSFSITFPPTYPDDPPAVIGTHHVADTTKKGEGEAAANILRDILGRVFAPGQVCLFDLIEEAGPLLAEHHEAQTHHGASENPAETPTSRSADTTTYASAFTLESPSDILTSVTLTASNIPPPKWVLSEPLTVNKSTFIARCLHVSSLSEATDSISHLLATNKKVAGATHNITAWRIKQLKTQAHTTTKEEPGPEIIIQDSDDDGETAAGGRLLHLMQLMDVWNVVVVVTRWYGGVNLGADRFRCINSVAREGLVRGGFVKEEGKGRDGANGRKKGRR